MELFCSKEKLNALVEKCKGFPSLTYMAVNRGGSWVSNVSQTDVNAVTWGVFPAKEIIQPTVVDPASFMVWKDEAFEIWTRGWARLYPEGEPSQKLLEEVWCCSSCTAFFLFLFTFFLGYRSWILILVRYEFDPLVRI